MSTDLILLYYDDGYTVITYDEAYEQASDYIKDSLWAFNASFLAGETRLDSVVFEKLGDLCEDGNGAITKLIESTCGLNAFIEQAITCDGIGNFLNTHDGWAIEFEQGDENYVAFIEG